MTFFGKGRIAKPIISIVLAALILIPMIGLEPTVTEGSCGVERWSVKTGTDPDAQYVDLNNLQGARIFELVRWPKPGYLPPNNRIDPYEFTACFMFAVVVEYVRESDQDYHLVLNDLRGNTMIAEIPDPACVGISSPFRDYIINARAEFDSMFHVTTSFQHTYTPALIAGVAFFDYNHNQTGHAPNFVELHPVLDINFL
jgi:hypothetical protein